MENISRFELGEIIGLYETAQQTENPVVREELARALNRIGLLTNISRYDLYQRKQEIERRLLL